MKAKKFLIADLVIIFALSALLLAAGIYFLLTTDPFAFINDGTLDNTGVAGLVIIIALGIPALFIKMLNILWIILGILLFFLGTGIGLALITKLRLSCLKVCLCIYTGINIAILYIVIHILIISLFALNKVYADNPAFLFPLVIFAYVTFETAAVSLTLNILTVKEIKNNYIYGIAAARN